MSKADTSMSQPRLDDQLITEYLQENPDFFLHNSELLTHLTLHSQQHGAVSLVERQQRVLREQITALQDEITTLMGHARRNERIFRSYSDLYIKLLQATSFEQIIECLSHTFILELGLSQLELKLLPPDLAIDDKHRFAADTHWQRISKRFNDGPVYLGRLTQDEKRALFGQSGGQEIEASGVESVALVQLGDATPVGVLALSSHDPSHFAPAMDYLLISQLQALLSIRLPDILNPPSSE